MATFIRLTDFKSSGEKEREFFNQENKFVVNEQDDFSKIPGSPIIYWFGSKFVDLFQGELFGETPIYTGMATSDNDRFLRLWHEVGIRKINFLATSIKDTKVNNIKWFPYNKGGSGKKWYGNFEYIVNFSNDGEEIKSEVNRKYPYLKGNTGFYIRYQEHYFKEGLTWSAVSSGNFCARKHSKHSIFSNAGFVSIPKDNLEFYISLLNSNISSFIINGLAQTINFNASDIAKLPVIFPKSDSLKQEIDPLTHQCIDISREEWNSRETSWDFTTNELLHNKTTNRIEDAYYNYCSYWKEQFFKLHTNEEELNRIFIDIYDLADELAPDVPLEDITILKDESEIKDGKLVFKKEVIIKQFISYAVGCMFGRYSPDKEGVVLANQGETIDDFREKVPNPSFMPDDDNIIPILEDEYFTDDIVSRFKQFLKASFGTDSLAENLDFIAGALSNSKNGSKSPEKTIRDYFLKSFFKDHVKTYKKRPIYWLFTSGKGRGFNALVYMHRYDTTTLAKMRTDYLLELESKLDARMDMLSPDSVRDKQEREKLSTQIEELAAYDEVLNNKALSFIDIDLDDGVVVNYGKFEGLVEKV